jgi:hypothetical protein
VVSLERAAKIAGLALREFIDCLGALKIPSRATRPTSYLGSSPSLAEIVVADAGPLIAFGRLDKFSVLGAIFDRVIVPQAVLKRERC